MTEILIENARGGGRAEQLLFTALDISNELGTSDRNLNQGWYPRLEEIYWWDTDSMKIGSRYTAIARERFIELQSAISPKIPLKNSDNLIVRNDDGKPLMANNPNRIGIKEYRHQVWKKLDKFPGKQRVDAPTELESIEAEICEESSIVLSESAYLTNENLGTVIDTEITNFANIGHAIGLEIGALIASQISETVNQQVTEGLKDLKKNINRSGKRKS